MSLIIGADLVPTPSNYQLFREIDMLSLLGRELWELLRQADYRIFNLETPLADREDPIAKCGPNHIVPTDLAAGIRALGTDLVTTANNHIMDQNVSGWLSTMESLRTQGISQVGTGENLQEASQPFLFRYAQRTIGVYACAEHEFTIASEQAAGANPFDPLESPDHVAALKKKCDYVIVLYHGGKEYYRYPSPGLQKTCRKLVEKGADLVVCQHSHCVGCEEKYLQGTIVYGQGNFLFDAGDDEFYNTGILVSLDENMQVSYLPLKKQGHCVSLAQGQVAEDIINGFMARSQEITSDDAVKDRYEAFAHSMSAYYLTALAGEDSFLFRIVNKVFGNRLRIKRLAKRYSKKRLRNIRNYVECEAHRELFLKGMEESEN